MRFRINDNPAHRASAKFRPEYAPACAWPREKTKPKSAPLNTWHSGGGGASIRQHINDLAEVKACMQRNREATVFDVALECHMTDKHARRLIKEAMG